jgi:glycosyltransferase involved in cell wall biosynthesis
MKIAFITNICPHYRVKTFELLAREYPIDFLFFSDGSEKYWLKEHGVSAGNFNHEYLPGIKIGNTMVSLALARNLWMEDYSIFLVGFSGKFSMPLTFLVSRLKHKPIILWTGIWMRLETRLHRLLFPITRLVYTHADAVVVYGEHIKRYLISEGVKPDRIFTTTHATDNDLYNQDISPDKKAQFLEAHHLPQDKQIFLFIGRLEDGKGLNYLIQAYHSLDLPQTALVLVGIGTQSQQIKELAAAGKNAAQIHFIGYVPNQETPVLYSLSRALLLPSITTTDFKEPWGLVVNEAFNQGIPAITTTAVGAAAGGLVIDGETGLVVPERDAPALAQAIFRMATDEQAFQSMSRNAREKIKTWDNHSMVDGFCKAIEAVTGKQALKG